MHAPNQSCNRSTTRTSTAQPPSKLATATVPSLSRTTIISGCRPAPTVERCVVLRFCVYVRTLCLRQAVLLPIMLVPVCTPPCISSKSTLRGLGVELPTPTSVINPHTYSSGEVKSRLENAAPRLPLSYASSYSRRAFHKRLPLHTTVSNPSTVPGGD